MLKQLLTRFAKIYLYDVHHNPHIYPQTGLRGMSGNKGAVGIRLEYHDTTFCFITAHLAAGHSNVVERNADYRTIVNGLHFLKGKTIDSHQSVHFHSWSKGKLTSELAGISYGWRIPITALTSTMSECEPLPSWTTSTRFLLLTRSGLCFVYHRVLIKVIT